MPQLKFTYPATGERRGGREPRINKGSARAHYLDATVNVGQAEMAAEAGDCHGAIRHMLKARESFGRAASKRSYQKLPEGIEAHGLLPVGLKATLRACPAKGRKG